MALSHAPSPSPSPLRLREGELRHTCSCACCSAKFCTSYLILFPLGSGLCRRLLGLAIYPVPESLLAGQQLIVHALYVLHPVACLHRQDLHLRKFDTHVARLQSTPLTRGNGTQVLQSSQAHMLAQGTQSLPFLASCARPLAWRRMR
jgi:hypothetical protein